MEPTATSAINTLNFEAWYRLLPMDAEDRDFILDGINYGFHLCTKFGPYYPTNRENYSSAFKVREKVEIQLRNEIALGNYVVTEKIPTIVSSLGAVPKQSG